MEKCWTPYREMIALCKKFGPLILRLVLAGIFIYASLYKIASPGAFAHQIYNYKILPSWAINPLALTLPWLQLLCGLALIFHIWAKEAVAHIIVMMVVFQIALASALVRGLNVSCGCFNAGGAPANWLTFGRDFSFLALAIVNFILIRKNCCGRQSQ